MKQEPYRLDATRRAVVLRTLREVCRWRRWEMLAVHVRTRHVHVVVQADASPEMVMTTFKSYASRALNQLGIDGEDRRRWAHHGSTRYLWTRDELLAAIHYVVCEQGASMAVFEAGDNAAP